METCCSVVSLVVSTGMSGETERLLHYTTLHYNYCPLVSGTNKFRAVLNYPTRISRRPDGFQTRRRRFLDRFSNIMPSLRDTSRTRVSLSDNIFHHVYTQPPRPGRRMAKQRLHGDGNLWLAAERLRFVRRCHARVVVTCRRLSPSGR